MTVKGTFHYLDRHQAPNDKFSDATAMRPIAFTNVEIWAFAPRASGIWTWAHEASTRTDAGGSLSREMPFQTSGVVYALRITATNDAAKVWPYHPDYPVAFNTVPFYVSPRDAAGGEKHRVATSASTPLDFSYDFTDDWSALHFNLADTVRLGFEYADARRDPAENDVIPQVSVQPTRLTGSWFNAPSDTIVINYDRRFNDRVIVHEYGHWLQEQIGAIPWVLSSHNGCEAKDALDQISNSPEHAWMEGFADYFAEAVRASLPQDPLVPWGDRLGGNSWAGALENPLCRYLDPRFANDEIELFVAAVLWDLRDPQSAEEPDDRLEGYDREIFQIMDRELDIAPGAGPWPSLSSFRTAWLARPDSLSSAERSTRLQKLERAITIRGARTTQIEPIAEEPPVPTVCRAKPHTPGCGGSSPAPGDDAGPPEK